MDFKNVRLLNGIPIDEEGNPLSPEDQRAYFEWRPRASVVESTTESPWSDESPDAMNATPWDRSGEDGGAGDSKGGAGSEGGAAAGPQGDASNASRPWDSGASGAQPWQPYANAGADGRAQPFGAGAGGWSGASGAPQGAPAASRQSAQSNGKATAAIVCGALAIFFSSTVLVGLALGIVALVLAASAAKGTRSGKAVVGRVLGIIGIVFSALTLLSAIAVGAFSFSSFDEVLPSDEPDYVDDFAYYDEQEQTVRALAEARLDQLSAMSDEQLAALGAELDEDLLGFTGSYSYTDIGVDPVEVARWLSSPITYEIESVYAFPEDGDASVYATVVSPDYYTLLSTYGDKANAFLSSEEAAAFDSDEGFARLGEIMRECLAAPYEPSESYLSIEFLKNGDAWVIDEDDWRYEMEYLFWLF